MIGAAKGNRKNKKTKTSVVFDEKARRDYLTGFRRRKNERRKKARDQAERELKEEVRKAREKAKEDLKRNPGGGQSLSSRILPEIQHLLPSEVQDYGSHVVAVTHLSGDDNQVLGGEGRQRPESSVGTDEESETAATWATPCGPSKTKADLRRMNRSALKKISKSKAFKNSKTMPSSSFSSSASKKAKKVAAKFDKKTAKSKRSKHHNPKKIVK